MRKTILTFGAIVLIAVGSLTVVSCGGNDEHENKEVATATYQCPMKCEGEKTYADKDVKCPVCGMDLVEVE